MTQSKIVELEERRGGATLHIPAEGEDGLFSESWFPIIPSAELKPGQIAKVPFLDGHVIAVRGESGRAEVLSPFCPHLGAGLDAGKMVGDAIQCPFHHWEFGLEGKCLRTGIGDPVFNEIFHPISRRLVARCDGCLRIGGPSAGADEMVSLARQAGRDVYFSIDEVPAAS
jgi:nitrite reductase/ring-hydroxylating ferredoxin subunit